MELAALEVPIRVTGTTQAVAGLGAVEKAGQQAAKTTSDLSAKLAAETAALRRMGEAARQAAQGEMAYQARLRMKLAALKGTTAASGEALAAGKREMAQWVASQKAAQGAATATVAVGTAARRATPGIRTLTGNLASMAAMELGLRSGLGSMAAVLGTLAMGSTLTLGVVAGLAAIAYQFRKVKEAAEAAAKTVADARDRLKEAQEARAAWLREQQGPVAAAEVDEGAAQVALQKARTAVTVAEGLERAARERVARAKQLQQLGSTGPTVGLAKAEMQLRAAIAATEAARLDLTSAEMAAITATEKLTKAKAEDAEVTEKVTTATIDLAAAQREHTQALAALAKAGIATADDMAELIAAQEQLEAATRSGTAEARAQAQALLEVVRAARLARLEGALDYGQPKLSKTSPPGYRGMAPGPSEFPTADLSPERLGAAIGITPEQLQLYQGLATALDPVNMKLDTLRVALYAGAEAWAGFWEGVGAGEGLDFGGLISGFARQMSQLFAAQAMGALAMGLTPPPLGNPAMLSAVPRLLAASAAFGLLAGATGGGGASGVGGGGGSRGGQGDYREFIAVPRLRPGGMSQAANGASRLAPAAPVVVNQTIIGERDPSAQRAIARLTENAARRGYRVGA